MEGNFCHIIRWGTGVTGFPPPRYFRKLTGTDELRGIRVQFATDIFRFLGFFDGSNVIVLNHAFQKKSQKAPNHEIVVAETRKREYLNRRD